MKQPSWQLAVMIACELVNRETDVNEVQKAVTYARVHASIPSEQVGEKFFALLETMVRDGRYLVRSGRTLDYYRDLREVCRQHLQDYRTATGERALELVDLLGWVVRFMRYYNTDAGKAELPERQRAGESRHPSREQPQPVPTPSSKQQLSIRPPTAKPVGPPAPARVETERESVTLITAAKGDKARVRTEQGEDIPCSNLPPYPPAMPGAVFAADVTREGGHGVKAVFKGWKRS